ncbi:MAG TPA: dihydrofolate reductase family protein [Spirochaetia bacterium]|nr:dihydrofolate reductase family protein [Spirochaetia bacterium]
MADVVYSVASSLDGYIATADGGIEWLTPYQSAGEDYGYAEFYASVQAVVMGRQTYEQAEGFGKWPFDGKPALIFSHHSLHVPFPDASATSAAPADALRDLEQRGLSRVWLVGGGELAGSFRREGLINEYLVTFIPVLLGAGVPLFAPPGPQEQLALTGTRSFPNGVVQLRYLRGDSA